MENANNFRSDNEVIMTREDQARTPSANEKQDTSFAQDDSPSPDYEDAGGDNSRLSLRDLLEPQVKQERAKPKT